MASFGAHKPVISLPVRPRQEMSIADEASLTAFSCKKNNERER